MKQFYKAPTPAQMSPQQRKSFVRSYTSYSKYYDKLDHPAEKKMTPDEYFEEYKTQRRKLLSQGKSTAAIPRQIAASNKYERTYAQDLAQWTALKESDNYKKLHLAGTFQEFRRIQQKDLDDALWAEIYQARADLAKNGESTEEINRFISAYYFGSVL